MFISLTIPFEPESHVTSISKLLVASWGKRKAFSKMSYIWQTVFGQGEVDTLPNFKLLLKLGQSESMHVLQQANQQIANRKLSIVNLILELRLFSRTTVRFLHLEYGFRYFLLHVSHCFRYFSYSKCKSLTIFYRAIYNME